MPVLRWHFVGVAADEAVVVTADVAGHDGDEAAVEAVEIVAGVVVMETHSREPDLASCETTVAFEVVVLAVASDLGSVVVQAACASEKFRARPFQHHAAASFFACAVQSTPLQTLSSFARISVSRSGPRWEFAAGVPEPVQYAPSR